MCTWKFFFAQVSPDHRTVEGTVAVTTRCDLACWSRGRCSLSRRTAKTMSYACCEKVDFAISIMDASFLLAASGFR